jgi:hypothetical protein
MMSLSSRRGRTDIERPSAIPSAGCTAALRFVILLSLLLLERLPDRPSCCKSVIDPAAAIMVMQLFWVYFKTRHHLTLRWQRRSLAFPPRQTQSKFYILSIFMRDGIEEKMIEIMSSPFYAPGQGCTHNEMLYGSCAHFESLTFN